ncbi:hypothetical protein D3C81_1990240 [compost metagenome]
MKGYLQQIQRIVIEELLILVKMILLVFEIQAAMHMVLFDRGKQSCIRQMLLWSIWLVKNFTINIDRVQKGLKFGINI